jgi:hypothetical protein
LYHSAKGGPSDLYTQTTLVPWFELRNDYGKPVTEDEPGCVIAR